MIGAAHIGTAGFDPVAIGFVSFSAVAFLFFAILYAIFPDNKRDWIVAAFFGILSIVLIAAAIFLAFIYPHKALILDKGGQEVSTTAPAGQKVCTIDTLEFRCEVKQVGKNKYEIWGAE